MRLGIISGISSEGKVEWHVVFRIPKDMTADEWRDEIIAAVKDLPDDLEFRQQAYIDSFDIMEKVAERLARRHINIERVEWSFPWEVVRDDRGIGKHIPRSLLVKISQHNEHIDELVKVHDKWRDAG